ncbi:hypothetical protein [Spirosoma arcticum]
MLTFFIILISILVIGFISYLSSAWFGYQSSNVGPTPPHYGHLLNRLRKKNNPAIPPEKKPEQEEASSGNQ